MTSVVSVEVTPDLKFCKAYISVLGDEGGGKVNHPGVKERRRGTCAGSLPEG